jgi:hypothetical protein
MPNSSDFNLVTIIGFNYIHPIAALVERLIELPSSEPNEFQAAPLENGFSASLVGLTAFMAESAIRRTQYIQGSSEWLATSFLQKSLSSCPNVADVLELFVARDVIAHNHVWEAAVSWSASQEMRLVRASKLLRGNRAYDQVIDLPSMQTRRLRLNLFPTRVNRRDAAIALRTAGLFFGWLENQDRRYWYMSPQVLQFKGEVMSFEDFLPAALSALGAA